VDFVIPRSRDRVDAIECKWNYDAFEVAGLAAFRASYPRGRNFVVCPHLKTAFTKRIGNLAIEFTAPSTSLLK
jgi:hypothetical protein